MFDVDLLSVIVFDVEIELVWYNDCVFSHSQELSINVSPGGILSRVLIVFKPIFVSSTN